MSRATRTPEAELDLFETAVYIAQQEGIGAADSFLDLIDEKVNLLARSPHIGRRRDELEPGIRSFPVSAYGPYVIFYRVLKGGIEVVRVLHGSRDIPSLFK